MLTFVDAAPKTRPGAVECAVVQSHSTSMHQIEKACFALVKPRKRVALPVLLDELTRSLEDVPDPKDVVGVQSAKPDVVQKILKTFRGL